MNLLDRTISYVSPEAGVKREAARLQQQALAEFGANQRPEPVRTETKWRGASRALRSLSAWIPRLGSAITDLPTTERSTLAARSHDAYRNHLIARAAISRCKTNIVGSGLIMHPSVDAEILGISDEEADELNAIISAHFSTWADNPHECDVEATHDLYGQQMLALVSALLDGDCFGLTPHIEEPGGLWGLKVQLVDGARVSNPEGKQNSKTLVDGVEMNRFGKPLRYWIRRKHPGDTTVMEDGWDGIDVFGRESGRRRALHVWNEKDRIGQVRGAPYLAPIIEPLQTLETYSRAELMAAVVSALLTVFIKKTAGQQFDEDGAPLPTFEGEQASGDSPTDPPVIELGAAAVVDLAEGEEPEVVNPARPNAKFDPFFSAVVKQMGAALELPADELMLKYEASYSAARAAMLQAWRFYTTRRWFLVQQFCTPLYQLWFDEAVARGRIPVTGYNDPIRRAAYTAALWVGPARGSMDEDKEAKAAAQRIAMGVSNETIETAAMTGEDWRVVHATRQRELKIRARGLPEPAKAPPPVSRETEPADPPPEPDDDEDLEE